MSVISKRRESDDHPLLSYRLDYRLPETGQRFRNLVGRRTFSLKGNFKQGPAGKINPQPQPVESQRNNRSSDKQPGEDEPDSSVFDDGDHTPYQNFFLNHGEIKRRNERVTTRARTWKLRRPPTKARQKP